MKAEATALKNCFIIQDTIFTDERGYFFEAFNQRQFAQETGIQVNFIQDNQSHSSRGVLRGLHFQKGSAVQAKLVRVLQGSILDVAVDLRSNSPTFGKHIVIELTDKNQRQLFVPRGFAHGFVVLSETATLFYKCDNFYNKESAAGIIYNDTTLAIDWKISEQKLLLSDKDKSLPAFSKTGMQNLFSL